MNSKTATAFITPAFSDREAGQFLELAFQMNIAGVIRIRHGGLQERIDAVRRQSSKWVTDQSDDVTDYRCTDIKSSSASSQQADAPKDDGQGRSLTEMQDNEHLSGNSRCVGRPSFGCGCKHIYAFFFHQERYPATHLPIQSGLPTSPILSKHSPLASW